ncbi:MAG: DUF5677 domain-containing protein [archaeon]
MSKKGKKRKQFSSIKKHKSDGRVLRTIPRDMDKKISFIDWERDLMPEHIWIDLLAEEYKSKQWHKIYEHFLDELEGCCGGSIHLFGLISDFGEVPVEAREKFILTQKDLIYEVFYKPVGKILTLYADNPANWLILDEHKRSEDISFEKELARLANSLKRLIEAKDLYAGHIRAIPFTRVIKHRLVDVPFDEKMNDMFSRYPDRCTEKEKYSVQQNARVIMNSQYMITERYQKNLWPMYFWRHNYNLIPCHPISKSLDSGDELDVENMKSLQERIWKNCIKVMKYLDKVAMQYKYDLFDPLKDEIILGLFSRIIRLYISFSANPFLWNRDLSGVMLRCIGETTILFFYFANKATDEEFENFRKYSQGKDKLLMLHLQDTLSSKVSIEGKDIDQIAKDIGGGLAAEMMSIDLKGWTAKNIRDLALEVGLENIYRWVIDPCSSEMHGSWSSLQKSNLVVCAQILHRFHQVPKFFEPPIRLLTLHIAKEIYLQAKENGIKNLGFPEPDEILDEIPEINKAYDKVIESYKQGEA